MFKNVNLNTNAKLISGKRRKGRIRHEEESEIEGKWGGGGDSRSNQSLSVNKRELGGLFHIQPDVSLDVMTGSRCTARIPPAGFQETAAMFEVITLTERVC